jgi:hypothetical protein
MEHELEREELADYLVELESEHGPIPEPVLRKARAAWRKS